MGKLDFEFLYSILSTVVFCEIARFLQVSSESFYRKKLRSLSAQEYYD